MNKTLSFQYLKLKTNERPNVRTDVPPDERTNLTVPLAIDYGEVPNERAGKYRSKMRSFAPDFRIDLRLLFGISF